MLAASFMYQEFRPKEASAGEGGDVDREVLLGDDVGIAWDGGRLVRSAEPADVAADLGHKGRFALAGGVASAEKGADEVVDIGLESGPGAVEMLLVVKPVLPLAGRVSPTRDRSCG